MEGSKPWLEPSSRTLGPTGSPTDHADFSIVFSVAADIRSRSAALRRASVAEVLGVPGYVLGADMQAHA